MKKKFKSWIFVHRKTGRIGKRDEWAYDFQIKKPTRCNSDWKIVTVVVTQESE